MFIGLLHKTMYTAGALATLATFAIVVVKLPKSDLKTVLQAVILILLFVPTFYILLSL